MQLLPISALYLDLPSAESRAHYRRLVSSRTPAATRARPGSSVPELDRATPYDPTKPIKRWADPSKLNLKPDARVAYLIFAGGKLIQTEMSAHEAVNVNLPDVIEDGAFEVAWPCRPLAADERIVVAGNVAMVEKGTQE